ncbi:MAG TPA: sigma factor [Phycisphaerales bacterium]|nr:sigma factor [Phycisphaerales bacterium]
MDTGDGQTAGRPGADEARRELRALAAAAAGGDTAAFAQLEDRLRPALRRLFVERSGGKRADLADDLAQRSLVGLWGALRAGRYDPARAQITTFAYAIAQKVWLQHLRAAGRRDAAMERYTRLIGAPSEAASFDREHAALLDAVRRALDTPGELPDLTDDERWLLRSWALGESDRTLAAKLGIAASNVNVRKQRAYAKVRAYLERLGFGGG